MDFRVAIYDVDQYDNGTRLLSIFLVLTIETKGVFKSLPN